MPARLLAVVLLVQTAATGVPATAVPPAPVAASPVAADDASDGAPTAAGLEGLKRVYAESCLTRAYGTYDEVCTQLADRVRAYRRELARQGRRRPGG